MALLAAVAPARAADDSACKLCLSAQAQVPKVPLRVEIEGHARIEGEPNAYMRIEMPSTVVLYNSSGAELDLRDFPDLPSLPMLNAGGTLEFNFGARSQARPGEGGGFRGRIPIRIEYS